MDIMNEVVFDSGNKYGCISVKKQKYIEVDGERTDIGLPERRSFCPDQFAELSEYAPELAPVCAALWTYEVIAVWRAAQAV